MNTEMLNQRKKDILKAAIDTYIQSTQPVASQALVKRCHFNLSTATIRNEMAELESMGYFKQPHISAGRIPTDKGYRFYVDNLLQTEKLDKVTLARLSRYYQPERKSMEEIIKQTSKVLASVTHHTAVVIAPRFVSGKSNRVELVATEGKRVIVLLVSDLGVVENKLIHIEEDISIDELKELSELLNNENRKSLKENILGLKGKSRENFKRLYKKAQKVLKEFDEFKEKKEVYLDGTGFFLDEPEFKDRGKMVILFKKLEKKNTFERIFKSNKDEKVKVLIGRECGCSEMKDCSVVFASYHFKDEPIGAIGIIGPKRMDYRKVLSWVSSTAECLNDAFDHLVKNTGRGN